MVWGLLGRCDFHSCRDGTRSLRENGPFRLLEANQGSLVGIRQIGRSIEVLYIGCGIFALKLRTLGGRVWLGFRFEWLWGFEFFVRIYCGAGSSGCLLVTAFF